MVRSNEAEALLGVVKLPLPIFHGLCFTPALVNGQEDQATCLSVHHGGGDTMVECERRA
jgi:hypothetical protein